MWKKLNLDPYLTLHTNTNSNVTPDLNTKKKLALKKLTIPYIDTYTEQPELSPTISGKVKW